MRKRKTRVTSFNGRQAQFSSFRMAVSGELPLCVDLDGTLLRTDTLLESALALLKSKPLYVLLFHSGHEKASALCASSNSVVDLLSHPLLGQPGIADRAARPNGR